MWDNAWCVCVFDRDDEWTRVFRCSQLTSETHMRFEETVRAVSILHPVKTIPLEYLEAGGDQPRRMRFVIFSAKHLFSTHINSIRHPGDFMVHTVFEGEIVEMRRRKDKYRLTKVSEEEIVKLCEKEPYYIADIRTDAKLYFTEFFYIH